MLQSAFTFIKNILSHVLPLSPFQEFIDRFRGIPFLGWLNWFVPVGEILTVLGVYLTAVGLFYGYSILLRWLKVLGD